jgi:FkbM family methyltransferase
MDDAFAAYWSRLGWRGRATFFAHLFKASTQQHHRSLRPMLRALLPRDAVVIDVGAHGGQFAKLFARLVPAGHVHAVEPSGYARAILRRALAVNRLANVTVHACGLSDRPGTLELATPLKRSGSVGFGIAHMGADAAAAHTRPLIREPVPVHRLDDLAARLGLGRVDLIKADIEGWEMRMLVGARDIMSQHQPALLLEVSNGALARAGDDAASLAGLLGGLGYRPYVPAAPHGEAVWLPAEPPDDADILWLGPRQAARFPDGVPVPPPGRAA